MISACMSMRMARQSLVVRLLLYAARSSKKSWRNEHEKGERTS
jgi:hypothetical protein